MNCGPAHHGNVGTKDRLHRLAIAVCLLIPLTGTAGCVYEYPEPDRTSAAGSGPVYTPTADPAPVAGAPKPYRNPQILEQEAKNYADLDRFLGALPEQVLFGDVGPLDGPLRGFGSTEKVPAEAGPGHQARRGRSAKYPMRVHAQSRQKLTALVPEATVSGPLSMPVIESGPLAGFQSRTRGTDADPPFCPSSGARFPRSSDGPVSRA